MADLGNYCNADRDIEQICEDRAESKLWIAGLKSFLLPTQAGRSKIDGWTDGGLKFDDNRDLISGSQSDSSFNATQYISYFEVSVSSNIIASPKSYQFNTPLLSEEAYSALDLVNMHHKISGSDAFRVSVSSAPSTSSHGSALDDCDGLGDIYIWGEVICDNIVRVGLDKSTTTVSTRDDVLLPRPLGSNSVLAVQHIACGVKHAALVTRQGEVFTWGEESGGRLGHGMQKDITQPHLVESLSSCNFEFVACGEFHTCAVSSAGELYTWGDGTHNAGLLGNGVAVSHWIPKRISGPLEGLQVAMVTCGPWHTALVTSTGQLFTFGDGTFGVLGHGDRESVLFPREVESLRGLRTISVACGVWHTAAVVEVIATQSSASLSSGKLFTWGDGDKNRLGHGDKESRLEPTCVPALIDDDFHKVACGHTLTIGLATSGRVFTMGSTVYGQLGNPQVDGKFPCLVEGMLAGEVVEEIACGAYHAAVLTSKNEVYSWGKGGNGRLGLGDIEDRKTPTLVEGLKDRHVRYIACGSNYTMAICLHKWVSGAEQSQCASCRLAFGFTRKRHNCYNCGLVHCNACTSNKALRAAMAPNASKPYRVCDSCFAKLSKVGEAGFNSKKNGVPRLSGENKDKLDKSDIRLAKSVLPSNVVLIKQLDSKAAKQSKKSDTFLMGRSSQTSLMQLRDVVLSTAFDLRRTVPRPNHAPLRIGSRPVSPLSRRTSPPRFATPVPTTSGLSFSKSNADNLKKTNEILNQEVQKLRGQVERLTQQFKIKEAEIQKSAKAAQDARLLAAEEAAKSKAAKEVIKSLTAQLKDIAERLPPGVHDTESIRLPNVSNGVELNGTNYQKTNGENHLRLDSVYGSRVATPNSVTVKGAKSTAEFPVETGTRSSEIHQYKQIPGHFTANGRDSGSDRLSDCNGGIQARNSASEAVDNKDNATFQDGEIATKSRGALVSRNANQTEPEWIEQYEPGVYITLGTSALRDGARDLKRVRFSRRRFGEHQAETWWSENRDKVYMRYNVRGSDKSSVLSQGGRRSEGRASPPSQL